MTPFEQSLISLYKVNHFVTYFEDLNKTSITKSMLGERTFERASALTIEHLSLKS